MNGLYKKAGSTFVLKAFGLITAFIFQIALGRMLSPEAYGEYTMYLTYSMLFSVVSILGMDRNLIKEVARFSKNEHKCKSLLNFSFQISILITILFSIIILFSRKYIGFLSGFSASLLIAMIVVKTLVALLDGFLQGKGLVVQVTILNSVLNNILRILLFACFIFIDSNSLNAALYSFIISELITIIIRFKKFYRIKDFGIRTKGLFSKEQKTDFIKYSITITLISGLGLMIQNIDKIMISTYLDLSSVAVYKVTQNYVSLITIFSTPFIAFWPIISKLFSENKIEQIEIEMKRIISIVTYLVIPMFYIFLFLGDDLLRIFGEVYVTQKARLVLIILAFSFLVDAVSGPIGSILTMTKYAKYGLYNNIISLLTNFILTLLLIKKYGIIGVALGTGISIILNNLISIIEVKLLLGIFSFDYKNLVQIPALLIINYIISKLLTYKIRFNNIYFKIILFGILIYIINIAIFFVINHKNLKVLIKGDQNENSSRD